MFESILLTLAELHQSKLESELGYPYRQACPMSKRHLRCVSVAFRGVLETGKEILAFCMQAKAAGNVPH